MSKSIQVLAERARDRFGETLVDSIVDRGELTLIVKAADLTKVCRALRDEEAFGFEQLIDVCGVDYSTYGCDDWNSEEASNSGYSRAVSSEDATHTGIAHPHRFAAVYHLLSIAHNWRIRLRCYAENDDSPVLDSVVPIWKSANWFEREAFDLFGITFNDHPDLRRILTDYGFIGHPFRKDFPLGGNVEMRYDPELRRTIYEPVTIEPRVTQPRVIRVDARSQPARPKEGFPGS